MLPRGVLVEAQADVGGRLIPCPPGGCGLGFRFVPAYSEFDPPRVFFAVTWNTVPNDAGILQYEFENQILHDLGYSTDNR